MHAPVFDWSPPSKWGAGGLKLCASPPKGRGTSSEHESKSVKRFIGYECIMIRKMSSRGVSSKGSSREEEEARRKEEEEARKREEEEETRIREEEEEARRREKEEEARRREEEEEARRREKGGGRGSEEKREGKRGRREKGGRRGSEEKREGKRGKSTLTAVSKRKIRFFVLPCADMAKQAAAVASTSLPPVRDRSVGVKRGQNPNIGVEAAVSKRWGEKRTNPKHWGFPDYYPKKITITTSHEIRAHSTGHPATRLGIMNTHEGHLRDRSSRLLL